MTTSIAIALFDQVTALDALGPYSVLVNLPDTEVTLVAEQAGPVNDSGGRLTMHAHAAYGDVGDADVIVVPGGVITVEMAARRTHPVIEWISDLHGRTTWTTSVCTGSQLLGAAGLLTGVRATSHWFVRDDLADFGAIPTDERVVHDGKIITAAGVSAGIDMALELTAKLHSDDMARAVQLNIEYDPAPPFESGHPSIAPPHIVEQLSAGFARAIGKTP